MIDKTVKDKQKLTLSISREIIDKAKAEGINISAITEQILTAITFSPEKNTRDDVEETYTKFFEALKPFLRQYSTSIEVGTEYDDANGFTIPIRLGGDYLVKDLPTDDTWNTTISSSLDWLDSPKTIFEKLLPALIRGAQNNKEKMKEFEIYLRLLKALSSEDDEDKK